MLAETRILCIVNKAVSDALSGRGRCDRTMAHDVVNIQEVDAKNPSFSQYVKAFRHLPERLAAVSLLFPIGAFWRLRSRFGKTPHIRRSAAASWAVVVDAVTSLGKGYRLDRDEVIRQIEERCANQMQTPIDKLVNEYLATHPSYEYPRSGDVHSSVLMIGSEIKGWITNRLGGPLAYWTAGLESAKHWFPPGTDSKEYRMFRLHFEATGNASWNGLPEFDALDSDYGQWWRGMQSIPQQRDWLAE